MTRPLLLLLTLLLGVSLVACGDDSGDAGSSDTLAGITITGDPGEKPDVTWNGKLETDKVSTEVLAEGDGEEVAQGDQVLAHIWIGNGVTQKEAYSSYEAQPQRLTVDENQMGPVFVQGMEGHTIGSRVAITAPASDVFGPQGNAQLDIGNKDSVLLVIDLMDMYTPPKPKDVPEAQLPGIVSKNGKPVRLDFSGVDKPQQDGDLLRSVVKEGDGKPVTTDMQVTANYLGSVYGAKKPFDESYSKKPVPFQLSSVVDGWTYGLEGVKVGSRVLLQIPPDLGYGAQAQQNIPANSTLYFVVDIVSAK